MTDIELINLIAQIWVQNGGDIEGFDWSYNKIKDAIEELKRKNNNDS